MKCANHPDVDAAGACVYCGKLFCAICLVEVNGKNYCKADVSKVLDETKEQARQPQPAQVVVQQVVPPARKNGLRTASRVLIIIFGIIGIIWGFSGPILAGCSAVAVAISESSENSSAVSSTATNLATSAGKLVGSLIFIIAGMVLGLVGSSNSRAKTPTIVLGSLVIVMGVVSTILLQYVSGPVYVISGVLLLIAGLGQKEAIPAQAA